MAIYKAKSSLIHEWPTLHVYDRKTRTSDVHGEYTEIDHEDILHSDHTGGRAGRTYHADSIWSYALRHGDCPQRLYERALEFGHSTYWINQNGTIISDRHEPVREAVSIWPGQIVRFQGRFFKIETAANENLSLKECE